MRILQVSAFFAAHGGGIEAVADQLARRWAAQGHSVRWMAGGEESEAPADLPPGLCCQRARSWDPLERRIGLPFPIWHPASLLQLWRSLRWCQSLQLHDYLYVHSLVAIVMARLLGRPVLLTQHIGEIGFRSAVARVLLGLFNRSLGALALAGVQQVVFVGRPVMEFFRAKVRWRRPPLLIPNGVEHRRYRPASGRARSPGGPVALLFVGRFVEKKGLPLLRHCAQMPGARWSFIGWGPAGPATWSEQEQCGIRLLGRLQPDDIVQHYQDADLLVLPSTGEGFPLVLQEALACGTPVLVSTEVFEAFPESDDRCVLHVELRCNDAAGALRKRIEELVGNPERLATARAHAVALARQWDWDVCATRYTDLHVRLTRDDMTAP